jgi:hypothetical protein
MVARTAIVSITFVVFVVIAVVTGIYLAQAPGAGLGQGTRVRHRR